MTPGIMFVVKSKQAGQFIIVLGSKLIILSKRAHHSDGVAAMQQLHYKRNNVMLAHPPAGLIRRFWLSDTVRLVHEVEEAVLVSKPEGMLSDFSWRAPCSLVSYSMLRYPDSAHFNRCGLVHRLDKSTSGLLLLARSSHDQHILLSSFKTRIINKYYFSFLCSGSAKFSIIRAPIERSRKLRTLFVVSLQGKQSITFSRKCLKVGRGWCLVWLKPKTGRTHQIRVHCQYAGLPVIGDKKYGKAGEEAARLMLHSSELSFRHPTSKKRADLSFLINIKDCVRIMGAVRPPKNLASVLV